MGRILVIGGTGNVQPAFVTPTMTELTGAPPRTFGEWASDYAADFKA